MTRLTFGTCLPRGCAKRNVTQASALASALRDREDTLQHCATLLANYQFDRLTNVLRPYEQKYILQRRHKRERRRLDLRRGGFDAQDVELLRKGLNRMPRRVSTAHSKRAGVVLPLCNVDGVPCILFQLRSPKLRAHPDEVSARDHARENNVITLRTFQWHDDILFPVAGVLARRDDFGGRGKRSPR